MDSLSREIESFFTSIKDELDVSHRIFRAGRGKATAGGFSDVFKGELVRDGTELVVAIKRLRFNETDVDAYRVSSFVHEDFLSSCLHALVFRA